MVFGIIVDAFGHLFDIAVGIILASCLSNFVCWCLPVSASMYVAIPLLSSPSPKVAGNPLGDVLRQFEPVGRQKVALRL